MYNGSSKLGRTGGSGRGTGGKRPQSSYPLPPPHRPSGRLSIGAGVGAGSVSNNRNRNSIAAASEASQSVEETFSLVTGNNPLAFAMIIRLAPDLIDEIKRVEAQGGNPRIKFDAHAKNSSGNVIDVGGKEFKFTWSREPGDLCDIYEEHKSGEDGNGLLVESGNAWRKVNVQRILDESTTNHVKKLSEEAERKNKSRRAIVLEHGNPSTKSQLKALAAAEANPWRTSYKNKKELPFKKQKSEPPQVGGPPKSIYKPGMPSVAVTKERLSSSPLPSPPEQPGAPVSQFGAVNPTKFSVISEDRPRQPAKNNAAAISEKEIPTKATKGALETFEQKGKAGANKPTDLQGMLYTLLMENPKGMSLKALEKAVGDKIPNAVKKIEPIIKKIAIYQAPGRYHLKTGSELEGSKKPSSESESSPLVSHQQTPAHEYLPDQIPAPEPQVEAKRVDDLDDIAVKSQANKESDLLEKNDIQQHSPGNFGEKKATENSDGQGASSSDNESDSDTDSDSSDSGSDSGNHSRSRSRSRSPVGSGSGSSSDSESDAPSNSKEGSDEDVDIMTSDDDKESKHKLPASVPGLSTSPAPTAWKTPDGQAEQSIDNEKEDGHESDAIDIEKESSDDEPETKFDEHGSVSIKAGERPVEESKLFSPDRDELQERQNFIGSLFEDGENIAVDSVGHEQSDSTDRISKGKYKRGSDLESFEEKSDRTKKLKLESSAQQPVSGSLGVQLPNSHYVSTGILNKDSARNPPNQVTNKGELKGNFEFGSQKGYKEIISGKSSSDVQQAGVRSHDQSVWVRTAETGTRPDKHADSLVRGSKYLEKGVHANENLPVLKDKFYEDAQNEGTNGKKVSRNSRSGGSGDKQSQPSDSYHHKHGEIVGKLKDGRTFSSSQMGSSPRDNSRIGADEFPVNGKGRVLQREPSDLELGELREPFPEEAPGKNKFERNNSLKQLENKENNSDTWSYDVNKGKSTLKAGLESGKRSSPQVSSRFPSNHEGGSNKKNSEQKVEDLARLNHRSLQSHPQHISRVDHVEVDKSVDANAKSNQGISLEGCGESNRKASISTSQLQDTKRGQLPTKKGSKRQAPNPVVEVNDVRKDPVSAEHENSDPKRRESSSDENSCSYSKYEKDEPEVKGAIKDLSQYKEYVQEYRDKYDSYLSLNKILESYRDEFYKFGKDIESSRGRDTEKYFSLLGQLKESYRQCATRHKRLKKIFVILHEELKHLKERIKDYAQTYSKD